MFSTLVLLFISDPIWIIIGSVFGLAVSGMFMLISGAGWFTSVTCFGFYILAGFIIIWRINKLSQ